MWPRRKPPVSQKPKAKARFFTTDLDFIPGGEGYEKGVAASFQRTVQKDARLPSGVAMDADQLQIAKAQFDNFQAAIPEATFNWYGSQGFIGYQTCAMLMQNWLIDKAVTMPARDAIRNGFEISVPKDEKIDEADISKLRMLDVDYRLSDNMVEFIRFGRIFGIRHALFLVDGIDYEAPFNIDGVKKNSYRGICQIDPYWVTPELDSAAAANPMTKDFYEPTWWRVNGKRIHKSHFIIFKTCEVPDILKPSYFYGGIPVPQKIYERVYASERTANEAPMLAMTKRTTTVHVDIAQAEAKPDSFFDRINLWSYMRDNYGIKVLGEEEQMEQFDTSLADLDAVIMTQYQLVAAASNVPSTKLMGTTPKGFNSTGEYEEKSYHEELESIQQHELTNLVDRHHQLCIRSDLDKKFEVEISWRSLDVPDAKERAEINVQKANAGLTLINSGAITPADEHNRLVHDPDSGYANLTEVGDMSELIEDQDMPEEEGEGEEDKGDGDK